MSLLTVSERNYWVWLAIRRQASELKSDGYTTKLNKLVEGVRVDLFAEKGDHRSVYLFRTNKDSEEDIQRIRRIQRKIDSISGVNLHLVWAPAPSLSVDVQIDGLEEKLALQIGEDLGDLDQLSTHTTVEEVEGLEYDLVHVQDDGIRIGGSATVYVNLQYGSGSDVDNGLGSTTSESFPFSFEVLLDFDRNLKEVYELEVDTSGFYK